MKHRPAGGMLSPLKGDNGKCFQAFAKDFAFSKIFIPPAEKTYKTQISMKLI
ncbi:MAG: hypothetical protein PHR96_00370 [Clostridia bacterium]|nr:hypothetical protein [Clostridia bacterium]